MLWAERLSIGGQGEAKGRGQDALEDVVAADEDLAERADRLAVLVLLGICELRRGCLSQVADQVDRERGVVQTWRFM